MNILTKIILAVDSILLILVLVALMKGGLFWYSDGHHREDYYDASSIHPTSLYEPDIHNPHYIHRGELSSIGATLSRPATSRHHVTTTHPSCISKIRFGQQVEPSLQLQTNYGFWDFLYALFPPNGLIYRLFSFFYSIIYEISFHDLVIIYVFFGIIYIIYNFYICFAISDKPCKCMPGHRSSSKEGWHFPFTKSSNCPNPMEGEYYHRPHRHNAVHLSEHTAHEATAEEHTGQETYDEAEALHKGTHEPHKSNPHSKENHMVHEDDRMRHERHVHKGHHHEPPYHHRRRRRTNVL